MNLDNVQEIHETFADEWTKFVEEMPAAWKADQFFVHHKPVIISSRFGQNTPIGVPLMLSKEAEKWDDTRTWSELKYVSMAIASEIQ